PEKGKMCRFPGPEILHESAGFFRVGVQIE
ncbi:unnamed protein product, partial [marine sediment metagenome]